MPKSEVFCPDIIKMKNDKGIYTESPELPKSEGCGDEIVYSWKNIAGHLDRNNRWKPCPECQSQQRISSSNITKSAGTDTLKSKIEREICFGFSSDKKRCLEIVKEFIRQENELIDLLFYSKMSKGEFLERREELSGLSDDSEIYSTAKDGVK